ASAPALAAFGDRLDVLVRAADGELHHLHCEPRSQCPAISAVPGAWETLPPGPTGPFIGKPTAAWEIDGSYLYVAGVGSDHIPRLDGYAPGPRWGIWAALPIDLPFDDA